ncbi:MAG: ABC transporter ATP-binding protein [Chloroflexota bacterium]
MSFSIGSSSQGMGPRSAIRNFGSDKDGRFFDGRVVTRMLGFLRPYTGRMILAFCLMLLATGLTLLVPYLIKEAIDQHIFNGDTAGLNRIALLIIGAFIGIYVTTAGQRYLLSWVGQRVLANLRDQLFRHLQALPLAYHDKHIVGVTVSRVINDVAVINELLSQGLITLIGDLLTLIGILIIMLALDFQLALLTFIVLPIMIVITVLFSQRAKVAFREIRARVADVVGNLAEDIAGMKVIQAFAQETASQARFQDLNDKNRQANVDAMTLSFMYLPSVEFLGMVATAIILWFGGLAVREDELTLGVLVAFLAYVTRFFQPLQELSRIYTTMQSAMAGGEQVLRLLDTPASIADAPDAVLMPVIKGDVKFDNVSFAYLEDTPVLTDINLTIEAGQTVALVGPTGAGKTSIANLVARFYEVTEGSITIDGHDIRAVSQQSLRGQSGLVPQDPFLFSGTIADNIRFAKLDASEDEIQAAAKQANAHDFIDNLPGRYQTQILEGGANLSVGQRQLLCIARAILADPRILILDEATANIDTLTEVLIQNALEQLLSGRTALVIAHRLSTIRNADVICVIQDGQIVQQGNHDHLLSQEGLYRNLYENQFLAEQAVK